jgi:hypothetical protein
MTDDIEDLELRKALADAQLAYWNECHREAARLHLNWEIAGEGVTLRHNGKRTGPRTPHTLLNWFLRNHPDKADQIHQRFVAMIRFSGKVTVRRDWRQ